MHERPLPGAFTVEEVTELSIGPILHVAEDFDSLEPGRVYAAQLVDAHGNRAPCLVTVEYLLRRKSQTEVPVLRILSLPRPNCAAGDRLEPAELESPPHGA